MSSFLKRVGDVVRSEISSRLHDDDDESNAEALTDEERGELDRSAAGGVDLDRRGPVVQARPASFAMPKPDVDSAWRMLELPADRTLDEVREAYRGLSRKYHPRSLLPGEAGAAAQTVIDALTEAREVLEAHLLPIPGRRDAGARADEHSG